MLGTPKEIRDRALAPGINPSEDIEDQHSPIRLLQLAWHLILSTVCLASNYSD
jgi:hypothetical protein